MPQSLVTIATDGFRNYVEMPDGRSLNLGSVSVLKLVTTLVKSSTSCRGVLDSFLDKGKAVASVDVDKLEKMLAPKRSRWAAGKDLIPNLSRQGMAVQGHTVVGADEFTKRELVEFMQNESQLLRARGQVLKALLRKNHYDHNYAKGLWSNLVDEAVDLYSLDLDEDGKVLFPKPLRDSVAKELADREKKLIEDGEYSYIKTGDDDMSDMYKLAAAEIPFVNEGLVHLVAAKVQGAMKVVEASEKAGTETAKSDLHTIAKRLDGLVKKASMSSPELRPALLDLAQKADRVRSFFG